MSERNTGGIVKKDENKKKQGLSKSGSEERRRQIEEEERLAEEQRKQEELIAEAEKKKAELERLKERIKALDIFIYRINHSFRIPLLLCFFSIDTTDSDGNRYIGEADLLSRYHGHGWVFMFRWNFLKGI